MAEPKPRSAETGPWSPTSVDEPHRVVDIVPRTPSILELCLAPVAVPLVYRPGQYLLLEDRDGTVSPRSYSVANAPRGDGRLSLLVTRVPGGHASEWIHGRLRAGDEVSISGPYGTFVDDSGRTAGALFLAAGSGLAPIRALLEAALADGRRRSLTLVFSARTEADVIDGARFAELDGLEARFRYVRTLTRGGGPPPHGRIPALLPGLSEPLGDRDVFVAGAPGFVTACTDAAGALGVPRSRIHTEVFFTEPRPWSGTAPQAAEQTP